MKSFHITSQQQFLQEFVKSYYQQSAARVTKKLQELVRQLELVKVTVALGKKTEPVNVSTRKTEGELVDRGGGESMSKNFELMQEAGMGVHLPVIPEAKPRAWAFDHEDRHTTRSAEFSVDEIMREESLKLVQSIFLSGKEASPRVIIFAGIDSGSGCSGICAHTAETLAGHKLGTVCLVDANFRSPTLPKLFGVSNHFGLTDALRDQGTIRGFSKQVRAENLWLLSGGSLPAESFSLLNGEGMKDSHG